MHERDLRRYIFDTVWVADLNNAESCFFSNAGTIKSKSVHSDTNKYKKVYTAILSVESVHSDTDSPNFYKTPASQALECKYVQFALSSLFWHVGQS